MTDRVRNIGQIISGKTAVFDEIDAVWLSVMDISDKQYKKRLEMITELKQALNEFFKWQMTEITNNEFFSEKELLEFLEKKSIHYREVFRAVYISFVAKYFDEFVTLVNEELTDSEVESNISEFSAKWIADHSVKISESIISSTCDIYKDSFNEASQQHKQFKEMAQLIASELYKKEVLISRNEMLSVCSLATFESLMKLGYEYKQWCSVKDSKTRRSHIAADGQLRKLDEPFIVGGCKMMFPQDDSLGASLSEIINCRCYLKIKPRK